LVVVGLLEDLVVDVAGKSLLGGHQLLVHRKRRLRGGRGGLEVKLTGFGGYRVDVRERVVLG
jgi:hypothetical protein